MSINGPQPEQDHETLSVVRELMAEGVGFAGALILASADDVRRLVALAKRCAEAPAKSVAP
jgi:hypothetical protein